MKCRYCTAGGGSTGRRPPRRRDCWKRNEEAVSRRDEVQAGLEQPLDLSQLEVDRSAGPSTVAITTRFRMDEVAALFEEAERRGVKKTVVIHDLALEALAAQNQADDEPVSVRPSDVVRAIKRAGRQPAA
jgi:hypothetical protein